MTCPTCGEKSPNNVRYCPRCGTNLVGEARLNRGCFIPVLLLLCTLAASWVVFEIARATDDRFAPTTLPVIAPTSLPATN